MTGWDILNNLMHAFPPVAMALLLGVAVTAVIIFVAGFSRHGVNFIKYGFRQTILDSSLEKRFDSIDAKFDSIDAKFDKLDAKLTANINALDLKLTANINALDAKIVAIETNHFGHLKNFLTELTSILLDKSVINNTDKARLDNELRGM